MLIRVLSGRLPRCDKISLFSGRHLQKHPHIHLSFQSALKASPTKCLAGKVLPHSDNHLLQINTIYTITLSFGNGTYQPKTSERRHGWEISFKSTLLLVAEGGIKPFFGDMPLAKMITYINFPHCLPNAITANNSTTCLRGASIA